MKADGQDFLEQLTGFPPNTFEGRFLKTSVRLGLGADLDSDELSLLYRAAFRAALCNIAFNGLGGCDGQIRPEQEGSRTRLEMEFVLARDRFLACAGWKTLQKSQKTSIEKILFRVLVEDKNLAQ
jgi:hypothetical protein